MVRQGCGVVRGGGRCAILVSCPRLASRMHVIVIYIYIYIFDFWVETGVPVLDDIYIRLRGAHVSESFIYS